MQAELLRLAAAEQPFCLKAHLKSISAHRSLCAGNPTNQVACEKLYDAYKLLCLYHPLSVTPTFLQEWQTDYERYSPFPKNQRLSDISVCNLFSSLYEVPPSVAAGVVCALSGCRNSDEQSIEMVAYECFDACIDTAMAVHRGIAYQFRCDDMNAVTEYFAYLRSYVAIFGNDFRLASKWWKLYRKAIDELPPPSFLLRGRDEADWIDTEVRSVFMQWLAIPHSTIDETLSSFAESEFNDKKIVGPATELARRTQLVSEVRENFLKDCLHGVPYKYMTELYDKDLGHVAVYEHFSSLCTAAHSGEEVHAQEIVSFSKSLAKLVGDSKSENITKTAFQNDFKYTLIPVFFASIQLLFFSNVHTVPGEKRDRTEAQQDSNERIQSSDFTNFLIQVCIHFLRVIEQSSVFGSNTCDTDKIESKPKIDLLNCIKENIITKLLLAKDALGITVDVAKTFSLENGKYKVNSYPLFLEGVSCRIAASILIRVLPDKDEHNIQEACVVLSDLLQHILSSTRDLIDESTDINYEILIKCSVNTEKIIQLLIAMSFRDKVLLQKKITQLSSLAYEVLNIQKTKQKAKEIGTDVSSALKESAKTLRNAALHLILYTNSNNDTQLQKLANVLSGSDIV